MMMMLMMIKMMIMMITVISPIISGSTTVINVLFQYFLEQMSVIMKFGV